MERLLGREVPVGAAAHRGTAVEAGVILALNGATPAEAADIANATFTELTVFSADPRREMHTRGG